jgi:glycosyltransferase involved in cell wall biosynthesis
MDPMDSTKPSPPLKLLVFAHTPPPHHGQSYMVQLMVEGLGGDVGAKRGVKTCCDDSPERLRARERGVECHHINARLSDGLEDLGSMRAGKLTRLLGYCRQAWAARLRHGVRAFYYVPAPPKRASVYRDWVVLLLCRLAFRRVVFHWHAVGLGAWIEQEARPWERALSRLLLGRADLAIVLSDFNRPDAECFGPHRVAVVANGIPDPCPDFAERLAPQRREGAEERRRLLAGGEGPAASETTQVRVLYLAHCTRDKGLFDAVEGVRQANAELTERRVPLRFTLTVGGKFLDAREEQEFAVLRTAGEREGWLRMAGFLSGEEKVRAFEEADLFCFPTWFANEGQPVNVIEAMAYGLPVVTTRWRSIPEMLPEGYAGLIEPKQPGQVGKALITLLPEDGQNLREQFLARFTLERHLEALAAALRSVEDGARGAVTRSG